MLTCSRKRTIVDTWLINSSNMQRKTTDADGMMLDFSY